MICEKNAFQFACWLDFWLYGATHPLSCTATPASWSGVLLGAHVWCDRVAPRTGWSLWCGVVWCGSWKPYLYLAQPPRSPLCPTPTGLAPMSLLSPP